MRRLLITAALLAMVAFAVATTAAEPRMSVSVDGIRLVTKELVAVDVTFACQPPVLGAHREAAFEWPYISVEVQQGAGVRQAYGSGGLDFGNSTMCDGARHAVSITVAADSAGRPFKSGRAVVSAAGDASYFWWNNRTGREGYVDQWATTGWMPTRLHR